MKYLLPKLVLLFGLSLFASGYSHVIPAMAFEPTSDCVIEEFNSGIFVQTDSSLRIQEALKVDCGTLQKHGIFRILPTWAPNRVKSEFNGAPVTLESITNEKGQPWRYQTLTDSMDGTVTWKIGDPDVFISGINYYFINYTVQNAITLRDGKHQLYWNINGNFWELPTNKLKAEVVLPAGVKQGDYEIGLYSGSFGTKDAGVAKVARYTDPTGTERVVVESTRELSPGEGVTVNVDFPTGIVSLYEPTWWDLYGWSVLPIAMLLIVLAVFMWAFNKWRRLGKELPMSRPVTAEFSPPNNLGPMEAEMFAPRGINSSNLISATIVDLAVRGWLRLEEQPSAWMTGKDWAFVLLKDTREGLRDYEVTILEGLFGESWQINDRVLMSSQKNKFYTTANLVSMRVKKSFEDRGWYDSTSSKEGGKMVIGGFVILFLTFWVSWLGVWTIPVGIVVSAILIIFGFLMTRRTHEGAEVFRLIKGFKLYMSRAEKYRMQFYEKENIFEKYLPYAIAFGLTGLWVKAFRSMYGQEAVASYMPVWYVGGHGQAFDIGSFESDLNTLSSQMASALTSSPSSSGSGGGGFSGGGGGGGGGGSW